MINLGDKVKDIVTGFTGIAVSRTNYLQGCTRIGVQPDQLTKEYKVHEWTYFDEPQLKVIISKKVKEGQKITGGPRPDAPSR